MQLCFQLKVCTTYTIHRKICFLSPPSVSLSKDDVVYFAGFPAEIDNHLRIVFGVGVPTEDALSLPAFLPQSQLASIVLINQLSLQVAAGNIIGLFSLFTQVFNGIHCTYNFQLQIQHSYMHTTLWCTECVYILFCWCYSHRRSPAQHQLLLLNQLQRQQ